MIRNNFLNRSLSPATDGDRPHKKARTEIKTELGAATASTAAKTNPPLIPFVTAARFYAACYIDLTRATIDLSSANSVLQESIPVSLIPNANVSAMSKLPIVQSAEDPTKAHRTLTQPAAINHTMALRQGSHPLSYGDIANTARDQMDRLLQNPSQRQQHERQHFKLAKIRAKHLANISLSSSRHPTMGMRGVIAACPLTAGTPLQYSGQYLDQQEYHQTIRQLSQELQAKTGIEASTAEQEASRLIACYTWENITFKGKKYDISAFGAGNTAAMINHDSQQANMGVAYMSTYDAAGQPAPQIVVYFALREIAKDEQLLVNYGEHYQFDQRVEGSMTIAASSPAPLSSPHLSLGLRQAMPRVMATKTEAPTIATSTNERELSTASILLALANTSHSDNSDSTQASTQALTPLRKKALEDFLKGVNPQLNNPAKCQDAHNHADFFFRQASLPLTFKKSSLSEVLFRILKKNDIGSLAKLRSDWQALNQLQPRITPAQLLTIASNKGGNRTLDYIKDHWDQLNQAPLGIAPEKFLNIANHSGGALTLCYIKDYWGELTQLQPSITTEQLLKIAAHDGGSNNLMYLKKHWTILNQLQPRIIPDRLLKIINHDGGRKNLDYIKNNWTELNQLQPPIATEDLLCIANNGGSSKTLAYLKQNWQKLNQLQPRLAPEKLLNIANNDGGSGTLDTLIENGEALMQLQPPIDPDKLLDIANKGGGKKTLNYLKTSWVSLNQIEPAIAPEKLLDIASNVGSTNTLENLKKHWLALTQLQPTISPENLLEIANHEGSNNTLTCLRENWSILSGFTNNKNEKITLTQLLKISNRVAALKGIETLLYNHHIKTLPMDDIVHTLSEDRRTAKFLKQYPNTR